MRARRCIFHPFIVLIVSLIGASIYATYAALRFPADILPAHLSYVAPIIIPFVAFLFDRAERSRQYGIIQLVVDVLIIGTALGRVVGSVPFVSGHTLFLTYCLFTTRTLVPRLTAAIVLLQVIYLKYFVWHDWTTSTNGILLGALAAFVIWRFSERAQIERLTPRPTI